MIDWLFAAVIGAVSGALSGAFGIGGGIITTPAIRLLMGAPALVAVGTPLPVIIPGALTGALSYARAGLADLRSGIVMACAGIPMAVAGAWLTTEFGGTVVLLGTAALIIWAATDMILQAVREPACPAAEEGAEARDARPPVTPLLVIGLVTGLYSGFFGLGGGFVLVPLMTRWLHFPIKRAVGTSLVVVAILAVPGTIAHAVLGHVDWRIALGLIVGVIPGALLGSRLAIRANDRNIRIAFAVMLVVVAVWLGASELLGMG